MKAVLFAFPGEEGTLSGHWPRGSSVPAPSLHMK